MRNFVGGNDPEKHMQFVVARDPEGKIHKLLAENQSDWRSRGAGHDILGPWENKSKAAKIVEQLEEDEDEEDETEEETTNQPPEADAALKELTDLRAEAVAAGVVVNDQWGKKRLRSEIAAAKLRSAQA